MNIVHHFNYNAICHKTAIRLICHIKSDSMRYIVFYFNLQNKKLLFLDSYVVHAQLHHHIISIKFIRDIGNLIILPVSFIKSLQPHPVRF